MEEKSIEWLEIFVWLVLPLIVIGAIAYYEYYFGSMLVAWIFAALFVIILIRRIVIARMEVEPIIEAQIKEGSSSSTKAKRRSKKA